MKQILFVCEHGAAKSVVAAAHFNRLAAERGLSLLAVPRGTEPDEAFAAGAIHGLEMDGVALAGGRPRGVTATDIDASLRVIAFGDAAEALRDIRRDVERWDVPAVSEGYEAARTDIVDRLESLLEELSR